MQYELIEHIDSENHETAAGVFPEIVCQYSFDVFRVFEQSRNDKTLILNYRMSYHNFDIFLAKERTNFANQVMRVAENQNRLTSLQTLPYGILDEAFLPPDQWEVLG